MTAPALSERDLAVLRSFARRIDAADAGAHNNLGVLYYHKGLVAEAIEEFSRAMELDPKMQVAQRNLEIAYHSTGYYDTRVAELSERLFEHEGRSVSRWLHDRERGLVQAGPRRDPVSRRLETERQAVAALVGDLVRLRDQRRREERAVREHVHNVNARRAEK